MRMTEEETRILFAELQSSFGADLYACLRYVESRLTEESPESQQSCVTWFLRMVAEFDYLRDRGLADGYASAGDREQYEMFLANRKLPR